MATDSKEKAEFNGHSTDGEKKGIVSKLPPVAWDGGPETSSLENLGEMYDCYFRYLGSHARSAL